MPAALRGRDQGDALGAHLGSRPLTGPPWLLDLHQAADVAAEVARDGERPVDPRRGDLEDVGRRAHDVAGVERRR